MPSWAEPNCANTVIVGAAGVLPPYRHRRRLPDGTVLEVDAIIWCNGFRPALGHLRQLQLRDHHHGQVSVDGASGTRADREPRLHLVGYGDWTGPASATLLGVGRSARVTVADVVERLQSRA